jgi:hypothetical protein
MGHLLGLRGPLVLWEKNERKIDTLMELYDMI